MPANINDLLKFNFQDDQMPQGLGPLRPDYQPSAPEQEPPPMNPIVKDYLLKKAAPPMPASAPDASAGSPADSAPSQFDQFKSQFGDSELLKAKQQADDQKSGLGWAQFAAGIGDALAGRSSAQTAANFENIRKGIDDKTVGAFEKRKAAALQDISTKKALEGSDPNSEKSKVVQNTIKKLWGDKFSDAEIAKVTADDADLVYKPMELKSKLEQAAAAQEMAHEDRRLKNEAYKMQLGEKIDKNKADAYQKAVHDLNTFRGNNAVQQASAALTNAKNAMSLADKGNLSPDQLHLFASEMGKLATGGVPGHSEIQALIPDTMKTRLAKVTSFFSNSPSDADAQKFINNNKSYLKELIHNYGSVVDTYRANTLDGYKRKLSPEDYQELKQRYAPVPQDSGKPQTVIQNGHTYTLNPQTGEYE